MPLDPLGRYEILQELGRGAMGVVYKARDPLIDRTVAIKSVDLDTSVEEADAFERRFYREAKSAGRLNHLNIVTIHDVGRSGDSAYIAMEFLDGRSLREIIDSGVVLPQEQIADIAAQVADGLACAHRNGVVHRDIKPANIMLLDSGTVKITDFGIALLPKGSRTVAGVFGSPKYISPEQVVGKEADGRSDIFALGAVLYELLTGSPAFTASDLDAVLCQVISEEPEAPSSRNRNIAPGFDQIVARAMAKHPDDRYPSAQEMAQDLRNFRNVEPPANTQAPRTMERRARSRPPSGTTQLIKEIAVPLVAEASSATPNPPTSGAVSETRKTVLLVAAVSVLVVAVTWALAPKRVAKLERAPVEVAARVPAPIVETKREVPRLVAATKPDVPASNATARPDVPALASATRAVSPPPAPAVAVARVPLTLPHAGRLALAVTPWGEIYVDGKRRGISPPLTEIKLTPGKHVVEIRNTTFKRHSQTVDLAADASVRIKHKFQ